MLRQMGDEQRDDADDDIDDAEPAACQLEACVDADDLGGRRSERRLLRPA